MPSNLEYIKAKVVEAVPEIMELKFGCVVLFALSESGGSKATVLDVRDDEVLISYAPFHENSMGQLWRHKDKLEILGRDIQLADILRAMQLSGKCDGRAVDRHGRFFDWLKDDHHYPYWNLSKPLHLQSSETLQALREII